MEDNMKDQRLYLKVKIKSLADEAKIIRTEEKKTDDPEKYWGLILHRTGTVRREARHTLLAYGFLRGKKYHQIENKCDYPPSWEKVEKMVQKYGMPQIGWKLYWDLSPQGRTTAQEDLIKRFNDWKPQEKK